MSLLKPIYLFADSRPLFFKQEGNAFLASIWNFIESEYPKAAYIGASNGDNPDYYSIFEASMGNVGIQACGMIRSSFPEDDRKFLREADIVLLAGGSARTGWEVFEKSGLKEAIEEKYNEGAILIGVSAGAVQLGLMGWDDDDLEAEKFFYTFGLAPLIISAHDEKKSWERLKKAVAFMNDYYFGIGIPSGGGMLYHPDRMIEPVHFPVEEFAIRDGKFHHSLLMPGTTITI